MTSQKNWRMWQLAAQIPAIMPDSWDSFPSSSIQRSLAVGISLIAGLI
jgi:hypothetical protein